jgi:hypothetical protein
MAALAGVGGAIGKGRAGAVEAGMMGNGPAEAMEAGATGAGTAAGLGRAGAEASVRDPFSKGFLHPPSRPLKELS